MIEALQVLALALEEMLRMERKLLSVGAVQYAPLFFVLTRFYGMLQKRAKGEALDWDWLGWLEDIDDDEIRLRLRICLENDEALRDGGLPVLPAKRRTRGRRGGNKADGTGGRQRRLALVHGSDGALDEHVNQGGRNVEVAVAQNILQA